MQIKKIMTTKPIYVHLDDNIGDVADIIIRHGIHGVPVVDDDGLVRGIITETDFFIKDPVTIHLPSYIDIMRKTKAEESFSGEGKYNFKKILDTTAKDIMTRGCITVSPETDSDEFLRIIKRTHLKTLPVVDTNGRLKGIVTLVDFMKYVL